jgi:two-component system nitrate/nitrite response regulator NarL
VYRDGLVQAIKDRPDLDLVAEACDGREALESIQRHEPDVALLDVRMPGLEGPAVLQALVREHASTRVVFVSAFIDSALVYAAIAAGAAGYLSKDAARREICDALVAAARGTNVLSPELQAGLADEIRAREIDKARPILTERELAVLTLTSEGLTGREVAKMLTVAPSTVKTHLQHLYEKLGVSDRASAVAEGMRRGLLE